MPDQVPQFRPVRQGAVPLVDRHTRYNRTGRDPTRLAIYSSARWQKFRRYIRRTRVICARCDEDGRVVLGQHVHHKISPRIRPDLTYEEANVELLCKGCHSRHHATGGGDHG